MIRPLIALLACATIAALPTACQTGGVGDPCTPEEEHFPQFGGFRVSQEYIESRSFQCATRLCLVNHFQGRVSCPLGQSASTIKDCGGPAGPQDDLCDATKGEKCVPSGRLAPDCDPDDPTACANIGTCHPTQRICVCDPATPPLQGYSCHREGDVSVLRTFVCHTPGSCQSPDGDAASNAGKACCLPGTDTPVSEPVCGQCSRKSNRDAEQAVYCSCRCGVADGAPEEPDFNFCSCPAGFTCAEIRPDLGINDPQLTGKYCIKDDTVYSGNAISCGEVAGNHEKPCDGLGGS